MIKKKNKLISLLLIQLLFLIYILNTTYIYADVKFPVIPDEFNTNIDTKLPSINTNEYELKDPSSGVDVISSSITTYIKNLLENVILVFPTTIAICVMIYGGFIMILKADDESQRKKSIELIQYSIIGITLIIFSYVIVKFIVSIV